MDTSFNFANEFAVKNVQLFRENHETFIYAWERAQSKRGKMVYLFFINSDSYMSYSTIFWV